MTIVGEQHLDFVHRPRRLAGRSRRRSGAGRRGLALLLARLATATGHGQHDPHRHQRSHDSVILRATHKGLVRAEPPAGAGPDRLRL